MPLNIMVVDDSKTVRTIITKTLELARMPISSIYQAANGKEALEILDENWVDIVLTDINMPEMNGIEMIDKMQENGILDSIPVVVISTEGSTTRMKQLKQKGISAYIQKPFSPEQIRDVVTNLLGLRETTAHRDVINKIFSEVMEKLALMFCAPIENEDFPVEKEGYIQARMYFSSDKAYGMLSMTLPDEDYYEIAASFLNIESTNNVDEDEAIDALKEVLNITCGQILGAIEDSALLYELTVPEVSFFNSPFSINLINSPNSFCFKADDTPILLQFSIKDRTGDTDKLDPSEVKSLRNENQ